MQAGVLTIVMSYSLYPEVLAPQQAAEVAQALNWTLDNAARLGGDPAEVSFGYLHLMPIGPPRRVPVLRKLPSG